MSALAEAWHAWLAGALVLGRLGALLLGWLVWRALHKGDTLLSAPFQMAMMCICGLTMLAAFDDLARAALR